MLAKILNLLKWCRKCEMIVNAKKQKAGKGQPVVWYCPKCGDDL